MSRLEKINKSNAKIKKWRLALKILKTVNANEDKEKNNLVII